MIAILFVKLLMYEYYMAFGCMQTWQQFIVRTNVLVVSAARIKKFAKLEDRLDYEMLKP